jgi:RTC4-like domain
MISESPASDDTDHVDILPLEDFIEFVLLPHIATHLIALDMCISFPEADDARTASNEFGDMFHWNMENGAIISITDLNHAEAQDAVDRYLAERSPTPPPRKKRKAPVIAS